MDFFLIFFIIIFYLECQGSARAANSKEKGIPTEHLPIREMPSQRCFLREEKHKDVPRAAEPDWAREHWQGLNIP